MRDSVDALDTLKSVAGGLCFVLENSEEGAKCELLVEVFSFARLEDKL